MSGSLLSCALVLGSIQERCPLLLFAGAHHSACNMGHRRSHSHTLRVNFRLYANQLTPAQIVDCVELESFATPMAWMRVQCNSGVAGRRCRRCRCRWPTQWSMASLIISGRARGRRNRRRRLCCGRRRCIRLLAAGRNRFAFAPGRMADPTALATEYGRAVVGACQSKAVLAYVFGFQICVALAEQFVSVGNVRGEVFFNVFESQFVQS